MNTTPSGPLIGPPDSIDRVPPLPAQTPGQDAHHAQQQGGHGRHGWAMWLMCLPMLLIVGLLLLSGSAGLGAAVYALACLGMMAVMMLFMNHGTRR